MLKNTDKNKIIDIIKKFYEKALKFFKDTFNKESILAFIKKWTDIETWKEYFLPENPAEHPRLVRFLGLTFTLMCIFITIIFLISFSLVRIATPTVRVPSVLNMDIVDAIAILQSSNLKTRFEIVYSETEPKYQIIKQYPPQGSSVREGREINIMVSLGQDQYKVPKLCNLSKKDAVQILEEKRIPYEFLTVPANQYNNELDKVIAMNITADKKVSRNTPLVITITEAILENQYRMDNFIRQPLEFAANILFNNKITPIVVTTNVESLSDDGLIMEQNIAPETILIKNSSAVLSVGLYAYNQGEQEKLRWHIFQYSIPRVNNYQQQFITNEDGIIEDISEDEQITAKHYKAVVEDELGRQRTIYERVGAEGSSFIRVFKSFGKTKVYVYANDEIIGSREYGN